jgi:hypothetical protein
VAGVVIALAMSGAALAWEGEGVSSASLVSATFYANTVGNSQSQTCTAANNDSIQLTEATYTGTAASSSDTHLNGPITIDVRSSYDATTKAGSLSGDVEIGNPVSFEGRLTAVNSNGTVQGFLTGWENGGGKLLGNVTATFSTSGGFNSASSMATIGSGAGTNTAIVSGSACTQSSGGEDQNDNDQDEHSGGDNHNSTSNNSSTGNSVNHTHRDDHNSQH